ncbi:MAG: HINT domain-containing protein [Leptospirales bacterium]|nr:HINT domain-containing protein [Leptospirales bacterium]
MELSDEAEQQYRENPDQLAGDLESLGVLDQAEGAAELTAGIGSSRDTIWKSITGVFEDGYRNIVQGTISDDRGFIDPDTGEWRQRTCFVAGTLIRVHHSTPGARFQGGYYYKVVEDIVSGDLVLAKDEDSGELIYSRVQQTFIRQADRIYQIRYEDGTLIETTWSHPFYVRGQGWVQARYLRAGDIGETAAGQGLMISSVEIDPRYETVFNFEVQKRHNYFVSEAGVLVHNEEYAEFRAAVLANDNRISPNVLTSLDQDLQQMYEQIKATYADEALAKQGVRDLARAASGEVRDTDVVLNGAMTSAGGAGTGNLLVNENPNGTIRINAVNFSYSIGPSTPQGVGQSGSSNQVNVTTSRPNTPPVLYTGVYAQQTGITTSSGTPPRRWFETIRIDQTQGTSIFGGDPNAPNAQDWYVIGPLQSFNPRQLADAVRFSYDGGGATPGILANSRPKVHSGASLWGATNPGGTPMPAVRSDLGLGLGPPPPGDLGHNLLPVVGVEGGGPPVQLSPSIVRQILRANNN